jgi:tRNA(fMet)-specific endonuclease VapC
VPYLLETSCLISLIRGNRATTARFLSLVADGGLYTSVVAHAELLHGARRFSSIERRAQEARAIAELVERLAGVLPIWGELADVYAQITADLATRGLPIPSNDAWIAATAMAHDLVLVSEDSHFARVPGLLVENWSAE